eukprot:5707919-Prymnesium_polylepis.1
MEADGVSLQALPQEARDAAFKSIFRSMRTFVKVMVAHCTLALVPRSGNWAVETIGINATIMSTEHQRDDHTVDSAGKFLLLQPLPPLNLYADVPECGMPTHS